MCAVFDQSIDGLLVQLLSLGSQNQPAVKIDNASYEQKSSLHPLEEQQHTVRRIIRIQELSCSNKNVTTFILPIRDTSIIIEFENEFYIFSILVLILELFVSKSPLSTTVFLALAAFSS